jgi:hypothetical protein
MTDMLPITIRTFGLCQECGAVVHAEAKHFEWHVDQLPEHVEDPWEEALEKEAHGLVGEWDSLLRSAISLTADAIYQLDGDMETYIECIVSAATCIRQMAPEGTKWDEPSLLVPGGERPRLRSVVQSLLEADEGHSACFRNEGSVTCHLVSAEASLHALWLASVEG